MPFANRQLPGFALPGPASRSAIGAPKHHAIAASLAVMLAVVIGITAHSGWFRSLEHDWQSLVFNLADRPPSQQVHVVEMDAASMAAIQRWPWPREYYAQVIDRLDAAGARSISFDVDFSSAGNPAGDAALAAALARAAAPVALPTFAQHSGFRDGRQLDALPIPALRDKAYLTSVAIVPDADGLVRRMPFGTITHDIARPSLAAFVAGYDGTVTDSFPIDFSANVAAIPRHSFIAIARGEFDPAAVSGRDIIIGATAIELGDRYAVPRAGVVPGVMLQALAAETLRDGAPQYGSFLLLFALATGFATVIMTRRKRRSVAGLFLLASSAIIAAWCAAFAIARIWFEIMPALLVLVIAAGVQIGWLGASKLYRQHRMDTATGLPNHIAFDEACSKAGTQGYVVAAMLENYDAIKAAFGEQRCAALITRLAERLSVSSANAAIHRFDERILCWRALGHRETLEAQIAGLHAIMRSPIEVAGQRLACSVTFGLAPAADRSAAANAAHAATKAGKSGALVQIYSDAEDGAGLAEQLTLLGEINSALERDELILHYQPKLNLASGIIDSAEALARLQHPVHGLLPPSRFIPLAEEMGRIEDLTLALIRLCCADLARWQRQGLSMSAAVNISASLLGSGSFVSRAKSLVAHSNLPADTLTFEITETADLDSADTAASALQQFCDLGVRISVDDYGTGRSTLSYLKLLPVSELKIDRSFVENAHCVPSDGLLVRSTIQLAHELGLKVVAEGIEDEDCLAFIRASGCDYAQGYLIGHPVPAGDLAAMVRAQHAVAA